MLARVYENEMQLIKVCFDMEQRGILLDQKYTRQALMFEKGLLAQAKLDFQEETGESFKDSSKLFKQIFDARGDSYPVTEKGNPSFKADFLETLKTPVAKVINKIRHHEKRISTYYKPFLDFADTDGAIHPNFRQAGTQTGRFSVNSPNLQNPPKEDSPEDEKNIYFIRKCFVPRPGYVFVSVDYDQVEYRILMDYAGETKIIKDILDGGDVHQLVADQLGIDRKTAKTVNFSLLYGVGTTTLANNLNISVDRAKDLKYAYFQKLPKVRRLMRQVEQVALSRGYVKNWLGRRCHLTDRRFAYKMLNHLIQGGAADVIKRAMVELYPHFKGRQSSMLLNIHDELLFEMHPDDFDLLQKIKDVMESMYAAKNGMLLTVGFDHSHLSWGYWDKQEGWPSANTGAQF